MARPGFYNENINRAFPFLLETVGDPSKPAGSVETMPDAAVADCGFVTGHGSGFVAGIHNIWLDTVTRIGSEFIFAFKSDAPGLFSLSLEFIRMLTDPDYTVSFNVDVIDVPFQPHSASIYEPDPVTLCFFLGSSGTFTPPRSGRLHFYFNDSFFPDNTGGFTLVFDGTTYNIPCTIEGIEGPEVVGGHVYHYTATGDIMYRPHSNPVNNQHANPNGDLKNPFQAAPSQAPCPGLRYYGLTAKLLETVVKQSQSVPFSDSVSIIYPQDSVWYGYLVTGKMSAIAAALPADGQLTRQAGGGIVEPALVQSLDGAYVTSINLANQDRTRVMAPTDCPELLWPYPVGADKTYTGAVGLAGTIRILPGFNSDVQHDPFANAVVLNASKGSGAGEPCSEVPLFAGEILLPGTSLLDGSPRCNDVIRSVNGIGGRFISIKGGQGVTVTAVPADNEVVVDVDMNKMAVCYPGEIVSQVSETLPT